jgi:hypothetical protein
MNSSRTRSRRLGLGAALLACACAAPGAFANTVDFVTRINQCNGPKIDVSGNHSDLQLQAGTTKFELWNDFIESVNTVSVIQEDNDAGTVSVSLGTKRNGAQNGLRGCPLKGSVEVTVTTSKSLTANLRRTLVLKKSGDSSDHRQGINVKAIPSFDLTFQNSVGVPSCLTKTGTAAFLDNDKRLEIHLPAGHRGDHTNCTGPVALAITIPNQPSLDVSDDYAYTLPTAVSEKRSVSRAGSGLRTISLAAFVAVSNPPSFFTVSSVDSRDLDTVGFVPTQIVQLDLNALNIRALSNQTRLVLTAKAPNGKSSSVTLDIFPNNDNGFAIPASCAPDPLIAGSLITCRVTLAQPAPAGGEDLSWRLSTAGCFEQAGQVQFRPSPGTPDNTQPGVTIPANANTFDFTVRASAGGSNCASQVGNSHKFEAWIGTDTTFTSGPKYTTDSFAVRSQN